MREKRGHIRMHIRTQDAWRTASRLQVPISCLIATLLSLIITGSAVAAENICAKRDFAALRQLLVNADLVDARTVTQVLPGDSEGQLVFRQPYNEKTDIRVFETYGVDRET